MIRLQQQSLNIIQMSHQEIQIAPGVYITDFRPNSTLKGINEPKQQLTNDVGLLLDDCNSIESKSKMLEFTIQQIKKEEEWQKDGDFRDAVEEDWGVILKFCQQMKQKILKLAQLKYHPQTAKIEELLSIDRIDIRQQKARSELKSIVNTRDKELKELGAVEVEEEQGIYL